MGYFTVKWELKCQNLIMRFPVSERCHLDCQNIEFDVGMKRGPVGFFSVFAKIWKCHGFFFVLTFSKSAKRRPSQKAFVCTQKTTLRQAVYISTVCIHVSPSYKICFSKTFASFTTLRKNSKFDNSQVGFLQNSLNKYRIPKPTTS